MKYSVREVLEVALWELGMLGPLDAAVDLVEAMLDEKRLDKLNKENIANMGSADRTARDKAFALALNKRTDPMERWTRAMDRTLAAREAFDKARRRG